AIRFHSSREKPSGSRRSRSSRTRDTGERSRTKSAAVLARSSWSSVSTSCMAGTSVRQAEHALGDDVELDLAGPALDRVAARAQPLAGEVQLALVEAGALPAERLRAGDRDRDL